MILIGYCIIVPKLRRTLDCRVNSDSPEKSGILRHGKTLDEELHK